MESLQVSSAPDRGLSIKQSFIILLIFFFGQMVGAPVLVVTNLLKIDSGLSFFVFYVIGVGASTWFVWSYLKNRNLATPMNTEIEDFSILPFVIVATWAILFGVDIPLVSLIPVPEYLQEFFKNLEMDGIFSFLTIVIAAPILEELIFRGMMLEGLLRRYSPAVAIITSAVFFGIAHGNPVQLVSASLLGCFIGWIYYRTRSITWAIIVHLCNNLTAFLLSSIDSEELQSFEVNVIELYGGMTTFLFIILTCFVAGIGCVIYLNNRLVIDTESIIVPDPSQENSDNPNNTIDQN